MSRDEFVRADNQRNELYYLEVGRVIEVMQQVGTTLDDKRLVCRIEMAMGGILPNVPFYGGGIDTKTQFPHGLFAPPRANQLVGILFLRGNCQNPVACFPIPHPTWTLNNVNGKKLYSSIMEDLDDITLFHFSGTRIHLRKDGTVEFAKVINNQKYKMNIKIEETDKKKTITDLDNNHVIIFQDKKIFINDSNGNEITIDDNGISIIDKENNMVEMTGDGIKVTDTKNNVIETNNDGVKITDKSNNKYTMDSAGIKLEDKNGNKAEMKSSGIKAQDLNGNTLEMQAGKVAINGTACEVMT